MTLFPSDCHHPAEAYDIARKICLRCGMTKIDIVLSLESPPKP